MANINKYSSKDFDFFAQEYLKCRSNPLYFMYNYVHIPEIGGSLLMSPDHVHQKVRRVVRSLVRYNKVMFMATRQLGKALDIFTPIPLFNGGYKQLKDIVIGDILIDHRGLPTRVINKTEIFHDRPTYEVTFVSNKNPNDQEIIIADANHEWCVDNNWHETKTTAQLYLSRRTFHVSDFTLVQIRPTFERYRVQCIEVDNSYGTFKCGYLAIPTHNSTISAAMLEWAINFYPGIPAIILNMRQVAALENLDKIKFIHSHLPDWLRSPLKGRAEKKTYIELDNNSLVRTFYPASNSGPNQIARSLTAPILYIDEVAFIRHIDIAYRSAQPVLSKAREQASRNNYPYFILMTSTPNGTVGEGKFFYEMWSNSIDSDDIYNEDGSIVDNAGDIIKQPDKNGFIKVRYHWSEDPSKSENWYIEQKRELNFNTRSINQELDLIFIGSTTCIFDDEYLSNLVHRKPIEKVGLSHQCHLKLYKELDPKRYYLIGVDTAKSITGDYCAIEIYDYETFEQVGEFFGRLGSLTKFADIVLETIKYCNAMTNNRVLVGVESNSIGTAIIEHLENNNVTNQMFVDPSSRDPFKIGINTNSKTKDQMVTMFYDYITSDSELIHSPDLIDQLSVIEKHSNGSISAKSGYHDDLFMASCLCAYMKRKTVGESKYLSLDSPKSQSKDIFTDRQFIKTLFPENLPVGTSTISDMNIFESSRPFTNDIYNNEFFESIIN